MDDRQLEGRLLDLAFTTDAPITVSAFAFYAPCTLDEAAALLDRLASKGTLRVESDDDGELFYVMPNRQRLPVPAGQAMARRTGTPAGTAPTGDAALRAIRPMAATPPGSLVKPIMHIAAPVAAPVVALEKAAAGPDGMTECPYCAEPIRAVARKCKHCGEMLDAALRHGPAPVQVNVQNVQTLAAPPQAIVVHDGRQVSPGVAALLSFLWPGAGHLYVGRIGSGIVWMLGIILGYCALVIPGFILHMVSIFSAANAANQENAARTRALLVAPSDVV
jgi:TM2 domain-containing membrane protein YozV